jgi:hypothetical protein
MAASPNTVLLRAPRVALEKREKPSLSGYPQMGVLSQNKTRKLKISVTPSPILTPANLPAYGPAACAPHHKTTKRTQFCPPTHSAPSPIRGAKRFRQWIAEAPADSPPPQMRAISRAEQKMQKRRHTVTSANLPAFRPAGRRLGGPGAWDVWRIMAPDRCTRYGIAIEYIPVAGSWFSRLLCLFTNINAKVVATYLNTWFCLRRPPQNVRPAILRSWTS